MHELTVVVVSDLHATSEPPGDAAGSWLTVNTPRTRHEHPLVGLKDFLLCKDDFHPDLLLVAGDICNKADETALKSAWADLVDIASSIGSRLIATAGNHDLDSRHQADIDPRGALYDLDPPFPALTDQTRDHFWARNYAIIEPTDCGCDGDRLPWRVVTLNSAAFHGYTGPDGRELDHGRVSSRTARRLRSDLESRNQQAAVNILLVHHHLQQLPYIDQQEQSRIRDVEQLIELLEEQSPWIVIHGHKHRARLLFGGSEGHSPAIFAAASMSAFSYGQSAGAGVTNQAYILRFATEETLDDLYDLGVAGNFEALDWVPSKGWRYATSSNDFTLPGRGGFGWRANPRGLAQKIKQTTKTRDITSISYDDLLDLEPKLRYLSPIGIDKLAEELKRDDPVHVLRRDEHGEIVTVDRLISQKVDGV